MWELKEFGCRHCGKRAKDRTGSVEMCAKDGTAFFRGVYACGSPWVCAVCSARIRSVLAQRITILASKWMAAGNTLLHAGLTVPHDKGMRLKGTFDVIAGGWKYLTTGGKWTRCQDKNGLAGWLKAIEITCGCKNGFHPHIHVLFFLKGKDDAAIARLTRYIKDNWATFAVSQGYDRPSERRGVQVDVCYSAEEVGNYVCKTQDGKAVGNEVARGDMKQGKAGGRTFFEILADWSKDKNPEDRQLMEEYYYATKGRKCITTSRGLWSLCPGMPDEQSEQEIAEENEELDVELDKEEEDERR